MDCTHDGVVRSEHEELLARGSAIAAQIRAMDQVLYKERDLTHAVKLLNKSLPSLERQQQFLLESVAKEFGKVQAAVDLRRFVVSPCMPYLSLAPSVLPFSVHLRSLIFKAY